MARKEKVLSVNLHRAGYAKESPVVREISFHLNRGEIVGLIGPNGSGKSTVIKAIVGLLGHVEGEISFPGGDKTYAYIPEQPVFYDELTLMEHLELAASAYELDRDYYRARAEELLRRFKLDRVKHYFPVNFSKGMQQKAMIIVGLLLNPELFIIDEPFVGLDPSATARFIELLEENKAGGAAILLSTHQLDLAERICDAYIFLNEGKMIASGSLYSIQERCGLPGASLFDCFKKILEQDDDRN
ncbi:MAG: ABC transporter ATP-binding protein [Firmicutes bacterium]|nr:ABC transporter ATP-binding protein [Bacillota bacterium]